jgi:subtilisin family serine protease
VRRSSLGVSWGTLLVLVLTATVASAQRFTATPLTGERPLVRSGLKLPNGERLVSVIVKFDAQPLATYAGGVAGLAPTSPAVTGAARLDVNEPRSRDYLQYLAGVRRRFESAVAAAAPRARIVHDLPIVVGGVSMQVPESEVAALSSVPGVLAVYEDQLLEPDTDSSPQFLKAPQLWVRLGGQESAGENVIVGVLDTGIWPEHPSFSDPDPSGKPYAPPPPAPGGPRACQFSGGANPGPSFTCNNKLIGARRFMSTYDALVGLSPGEFTTARDEDGHGTHTSSTAGGNGSVAASIFGVARGIVSGIAPRAHIAMYKVCGVQGCFASDSAAAVQQAVLDGVNVINFSISGGANPYSDPVSLAFLDAYKAGVFVAASAGNNGPTADTTDHREPWVTTVAASTQARAFQNSFTLVSSDGASLTVSGASITAGISVPTPVVAAASSPTLDSLCQNSTVDAAFSGKVVVCQRGTNGRAEKGFNILQRGAVGMILYNQSAAVTDVETDNHFLPASHIQFADGQAVLAFLVAHPNVQATMTLSSAVTAQGDVMASFSSRGGPGQPLGVNKPDITAPGVQILAGHSPQHVDVAGGPNGELFQAIAGTSMSSPHIAGAGALLKDLFPAWGPGQIKSAIMTTAFQNVFKEDGVTPATPFDTGSGRVDLSHAYRPGVTFSATADDFVNLQNNLSLANLPSLYVPTMLGKVSVTRTMQSETAAPKVWLVAVDAPADVHVSVPRVLFVPGRSQTDLPITVDARTVPLNGVRHASLHLTTLGGDFQATFPITIVRREGVVTVEKACTETSIPWLGTTDCTIAMTNTSFDGAANVSMTDVLPLNLRLVSANGPAGTTTGPFGRLLSFTGTLAAAQPPDVSIGAGTSPGGGYLPLSLFGIAPIAGVGDDTITNFTVPAFSYGGETYTRIGVGSNGYLVVGGGTGADVSVNNQSFPDPTRPNNVLAPFWTDLNPGAAGAIRIGTLTDGVNTWLVVDWAAVKEFSTAKTASFEVWIGVNGAEDITFAYGTIQGNGDLGFLTVGAENRFGNRGANYYVNGTGALPDGTTQLRVSTSPPVPGETKTITFKVRGLLPGAWRNCAEMTSNFLFGTATSCVDGVVVK